MRSNQRSTEILILKIKFAAKCYTEKKSLAEMQILMCLMSLSLSVAAGITVCQEPRKKKHPQV